MTLILLLIFQVMLAMMLIKMETTVTVIGRTQSLCLSNFEAEEVLDLAVFPL